MRNTVIFIVGLIAGMVGLLDAIENYILTLRNTKDFGQGVPVFFNIWFVCLIVDIIALALLLIRKRELYAVIIFPIIMVDLMVFLLPTGICMATENQC